MLDLSYYLLHFLFSKIGEQEGRTCEERGAGGWGERWSKQCIPVWLNVKTIQYNKKHEVHQPYSPFFTLSIPCPISALPLTGPVLHSCPALFKCMFIIQRGFAMVLYLWVYCTLIRLVPSIVLHYPFPYPALFNSFQCISLCLLCTQAGCTSILFTLHYSLFFSLLRLVSSNNPTIGNMYSICVCAYIYVYVIMLIFV
jgi:hypothetical protein